MTERWLPVVGWEGLYEVSDHGRVRSLDRTVEMYNPRWNCSMKRLTRGRMLSLVDGRGPARGWKGSGNYHAVGLCSQEKGHKKVMVHRLVLTAFVGPDFTDGKLDGAHTDGNTLNNRLENLRWATRLENMEDMKEQGRKIHAAGRYSSIPRKAVLAVRKAAHVGLSVGDVAALLAVPALSLSTLSKILNDSKFLARNFGIHNAAPLGLRSKGSHRDRAVEVTARSACV